MKRLPIETLLTQMCKQFCSKNYCAMCQGIGQRAQEVGTAKLCGHCNGSGKCKKKKKQSS